MRMIIVWDEHGGMTTADESPPTDAPPEWLHDRIMDALAPHLERLRQEAAEKAEE
ncbi:hypothetical protein [Streptosporangium roseum]|uniref:hypothetical protein n=1 Tax=Streptosporangium roseum TaxID=2001 RepID=UPI00331BC70E